MSRAPQAAPLGGPRQGAQARPAAARYGVPDTANGRCDGASAPSIIGTASRCAKNGFLVRDTADGKGEGLPLLCLAIGLFLGSTTTPANEGDLLGGALRPARVGSRNAR
jgi:hypothetical protein